MSGVELKAGSGVELRTGGRGGRVVALCGDLVVAGVAGAEAGVTAVLRRGGWLVFGLPAAGFVDCGGPGVLLRVRGAARRGGCRGGPGWSWRVVSGGR